MIDQLLEGAEQIEKAVPAGAYAGPPQAHVKATAEEVVRSVQGVAARRQMPSVEQPKVRVSPRGTIQLIWERVWGNVCVCVRDWDNGGSVGWDTYPRGDTPPDPETSGSQPLSYVVEQIVGWLNR